jgi:hypothetical protein
MRKLLVGGVLTLVSVAGAAAPAFAHDCFNPKKPAGAGSWATVTLDENGEEIAFEQTKAHGAFISIDATALGVGVVDIHTPGNNPDGVVGPEHRQPKLACDGKGIDYVEACFGAEPGD